MAFRMPLGMEILGTNLEEIANVDFAVGPLGQPLKSDIQLVQFLLNFIIQEVPELRIRDRKNQVMRFLAVDGIFGGRTLDAIKSFQSEIRRVAAAEGEVASIAADGIVDSSNPTGVSTISQTIYTIVWLNVVRQSETGAPLDSDQVSVEPLRTNLLVLRGGGDGPAPPGPNPLPPPPPPPLLR